MKKKTYIKLMTATVLASTLLLGACGNKKETTQASSSAKTSQSSSSKAASASKESKTQKSSSSASSEKAKASTDQSSATATPSQAAPEQRQGQEVANQQVASQQTPAQASSTQQAPQAQSNQSSYDPTTDRKAAAGNWKGANGETITVSSGGQFTVESADGKKENYSIKGYSYTLDDGKYNAKIGGGKVIQITTGADGKVSSVALSQ